MRTNLCGARSGPRRWRGFVPAHVLAAICLLLAVIGLVPAELTLKSGTATAQGVCADGRRAAIEPNLQWGGLLRRGRLCSRGRFGLHFWQ